MLCEHRKDCKSEGNSELSPHQSVLVVKTPISAAKPRNPRAKNHLPALSCQLSTPPHKAAGTILPPLPNPHPLPTMADQPTTSGVDETPLSPIDSHHSLEKHLQMRPEAQDLKNRNILHDTNAAPYDPPPPPSTTLLDKSNTNTQIERSKPRRRN